jgi:hypothetical protein
MSTVVRPDFHAEAESPAGDRRVTQRRRHSGAGDDLLPSEYQHGEKPGFEEERENPFLRAKPEKRASVLLGFAG